MGVGGWASRAVPSSVCNEKAASQVPGQRRGHHTLTKQRPPPEDAGGAASPQWVVEEVIDPEPLMACREICFFSPSMTIQGDNVGSQRNRIVAEVISAL
jgi:hypothetical protein